MAKFLYKIGTFMAKHKWWGIIIWSILLLSIVIPLLVSSPKFDSDITMNGIKSLDTNEKIEEEFGQDSEKAQIKAVIKSEADDGIAKESTSKDIQKTLDNIKDNDNDVKNVSNPYETKQISKDKTTALVDINYDVSTSSLKDSSRDNVKDELKDLRDKHNLQTELTGNGMEEVGGGGAAELMGVIVAFIVLLITFGSIVAAGMPILTAIIGLGSSMGIISILTYFFDIPNIALTLAIMIGLAVGIDYALFILFRYRQLINKGTDYIKAVGLSIGTAGSAVVFAGITVIIAVCGLSIVGIDFLSLMGFGAAISVLFSVLTSLTLLPALMSFFHKQIKPKKTKSEFKNDNDTFWSKFVVGKPLAATLIALIILIVAAIPVTHMRLGIPDDGVKSETSTQKKVYDIISDKFGEGFNGQIAMLVNVKDQKDDAKSLQNDLSKLSKDINDMKNVDMATPPQLSKNKDYAIVSIIPEKGPNAKSTNDLVEDLRDYNDDAKNKYNFHTEIAGQSVVNIDMSQKLNDAIPLFASVIVVLAFVLLMVVFRSIIIPLKAVFGFILSLLATLGFTTFVMQDGFINSLFGIETTGPLLSFLPVIAIGILFGLAMDYEVFLMSRIHEEYAKTRNNDHSIKVGIKESGPVILSAAIIMFSVFIAFVFEDDVMIKSIGIALGFGVLFDAIVVRLLLIPALTKLFGKASWYIPGWLNRILPKIDVEGAELGELMPKDNTQNQSQNYNQTFNIYDDHDSNISNTIYVDNQTKYLFKELSNNDDNKVLYNALLNYKLQQKNDSDRDIKVNDFFHKEINNTNDDVSKNDVIELLTQQSNNIKKLNELIDKVVNKQ
ncbi:MMPL family transporter [Staphylococcus shinii]|uniref:MMPL family transporter n=1 Tax=Staphylococcus shinii TaxID=2912228 RepID=UPI003F85AA22